MIHTKRENIRLTPLQAAKDFVYWYGAIAGFLELSELTDADVAIDELTIAEERKIKQHILVVGERIIRYLRIEDLVGG